jgi:hypothetical protein
VTALNPFWQQPDRWNPYHKLKFPAYHLEIWQSYDGYEWGVFRGDLIARGSCPTETEAKTLAENFCLDHWRARTTA